MKRLIIFSAFALMTINSAKAITPPNLLEELENHVRTTDLGDCELNQDRQEFVNVEFKVVDGKIMILEIAGTNQSLLPVLTNKLNDVEIDAALCSEDSFLYKFTFEKR